MKKTIRLNESDLHRIISESVRITINEMWDDEFDSEQMEMYRQTIEADHIAKDVENGVYDDQLDQILNNGACDYFGLDTDLLEDEWITDAAVERKCVIDKDFALKYGHNPGNPNFGSDAHPSHASYMERYQGNENRFDWPSYQPALSDDYWKDAASRDLGQKLPNTFTKKGEFRKVKDLPSRFAKDLYGTDQADKRPLHRKGSLNRVGMPESRMRNIVKESIKYVLSESDYEDYNDWAKNSNASDKEKEDAGKRQDKRREGNSFHGDKLAYKQYRHKQFDKRGEDQDNKLALKKRTAKRLRDGWRF